MLHSRTDTAPVANHRSLLVPKVPPMRIDSAPSAGRAPIMPHSSRPSKVRSQTTRCAQPSPPGRRPTVLVATSMDRASVVALDRAANLAEAIGADLRLVHVATRRAHHQGSLLVAERTRSYKHAIYEWARFETGLVIPERCIHVRYGKVPTHVKAVARSVGADLVVVGGRSGRGCPEIGAKVRAMIERMFCPVLLASPLRQGDILAATDLEDPAIPVVSAAADFARSIGQRVSVVHNVPVGHGGSRLALPRDASGQLALGPLARLEGIVRSASVLEDATVTCRPSTTAAVLELARAREVDMVVVGAKKRLGRTARDVLDHSARSVLVVPAERGPGARRRDREARACAATGRSVGST